MNIPKHINKQLIIKRIRAITTDLTQIPTVSAQDLSEKLYNIISIFNKSEVDFGSIYSDAQYLHRWFIDQGFKEVKVHSEIYDISIDLIKLIDSITVKDNIVILNKDLHNESIQQIINALDELLISFASDGKLNNEEYSRLAPEIRELAKQNRTILEKSVNSAVFLF